MFFNHRITGKTRIYQNAWPWSVSESKKHLFLELRTMRAHMKSTGLSSSNKFKNHWTRWPSAFNASIDWISTLYQCLLLWIFKGLWSSPGHWFQASRATLPDLDIIDHIHSRASARLMKRRLQGSEYTDPHFQASLMIWSTMGKDRYKVAYKYRTN